MRYLLLIVFLPFSINLTYSQRVFEPKKISDSEIKFDGIIEKNEWKDAIKVELDNETEPGYNIKPIVNTIGYILYSDEYIYIGFHAKTNESVRASIRKRDDMGIFNDDLVGFDIDTYGDGRNNIFIGSNPYGSQFDVRILNSVSEEGRYDISYDLEYESKGSIGNNEYYIELKIPFSSIPFPNGRDQKWKFSFFRRYLDYQIQTSKTDRDNSCVTCQLNDILILNDIKINKKLDLLPYISSNIEGENNLQNNKLEYDKPKTNFGIGINAELTKNLSLELTVNPDFSQVEADVTKIDANSAYTLSYPEKRPFFNKGTDILKLNSNDLQPFYSRSINNPSYALKLLNQGRKSRIFYLSSIDNNSPYLIAGNDRSYFGEGGKSLVNVFRYQKLLKGGSKIGFLSTSRYYKGGGYGNLFGVDGLFQLSNNLRVSFDILKNFNQEPNRDWIDSDDTFDERTVKLDGEKFNGLGVSVGILRSTEKWSSYIGYKHIDPNYRGDVGFVVKNDRKWLTLLQSYKMFWDLGLFKKASFTVKKDIVYNYKNNLDVISLDGIIRADLRGNSTVSYYYDYDFISNYLDTDYKNYGTSIIELSSSPKEFITIRSNLRFGKDVAYNSDNPELGKEFLIFFSTRFQINNNFSITNSINKSSLKYLDKDEYFFNGFIYRFNTKYQFSRSVGLRLTSELNNFNDSFFIQPLFEWTPNPFTIFYIGGNQDLNKNGKKYFVDNSQVFVKFQYLISL